LIEFLKGLKVMEPGSAENAEGVLFKYFAANLDIVEDINFDGKKSMKTVPLWALKTWKEG
jgi:hypothetical protein